jgi:hypothetical protein
MFPIPVILLHIITYADDLDVTEARAMTSSHILITSTHSFHTGHTTVFLVHVVGAGARVVTKPDTKVLDLFRALFKDLQM